MAAINPCSSTPAWGLCLRFMYVFVKHGDVKDLDQKRWKLQNWNLVTDSLNGVVIAINKREQDYDGNHTLLFCYAYDR